MAGSKHNVFGALVSRLPRETRRTLARFTARVILVAVASILFVFLMIEVRDFAAGLDYFRFDPSTLEIADRPDWVTDDIELGARPQPAGREVSLPARGGQPAVHLELDAADEHVSLPGGTAGGGGHQAFFFSGRGGQCPRAALAAAEPVELLLASGGPLVPVDAGGGGPRIARAHLALAPGAQ